MNYIDLKKNLNFELLWQLFENATKMQTNSDKDIFQPGEAQIE